MGLLKNFNWGEAALGLFADPDVMAARQRRQQIEKAEAEEAGRRRALEAVIDGDASLSPEEKVYAKARPDAFITSRFRQAQIGQSGLAEAPDFLQKKDEPGAAQPMTESHFPAAWTTEPKGRAREDFCASPLEHLQAISGFRGRPSMRFFPEGHGRVPNIDDPHQPRFGRPIPIRTLGQHRAIPSGTEYFAPDGSLMRKR